MRTIIYTILILAISGDPLLAQPRKASPAKNRTVLLAPIRTMGAKSSPKIAEGVRSRLLQAMQTIPGVSLVRGKNIRAQIAKANKPNLHHCDGNPQCLAQLGALFRVRGVVYVELGRLGNLRIANLKLIGVKHAREVRATTLEFPGQTPPLKNTQAAAYRLLAPHHYKGTLNIRTDVQGAFIFVDGKRVATSPTKPIRLSVGKRAVRVTHPEFRDFVRFVDIQFNQKTEVSVPLQQYPIVASELQKNPSPTPLPRRQRSTPWYRRWYTIAAVSAVVLTGSAIAIGYAVDGVDAEKEVTLDDP